MMQLMAEQDDTADGTCPIKVINDIVYDFRCYFCKKLPRPGSANRSELMRHYSLYHYAKELHREFSHLEKCPHGCEISGKTRLISHMGQKHNEVVKYLPPEAVMLCNALELKGQHKKYRSRRAPVVVKRKLAGSQWTPDLPEGYDPAAPDREAQVENEASEESLFSIMIDGIELVYEVDDGMAPLKDTSTSDYDNVTGKCFVCKVEKTVVEIAFHLHLEHGIEVIGNICFIKYNLK